MGEQAVQLSSFEDESSAVMVFFQIWTRTAVTKPARERSERSERSDKQEVGACAPFAIDPLTIRMMLW
jgi:hypothetical protein